MAQRRLRMLRKIMSPKTMLTQSSKEPLENALTAKGGQIGNAIGDDLVLSREIWFGL